MRNRIKRPGVSGPLQKVGGSGAPCLTAGQERAAVGAAAPLSAEVRNLTKTYAESGMSARTVSLFRWNRGGRSAKEKRRLEVAAIRNLNLRFQPREFTVISGPSGSGKSTLLNLLGTLDAPTSGEVWLLGRRVDNLNEDALAELRLRRIGFVLQANNLVPVLSAFENVEYVLRLQGLNAHERGIRAAEALAWVGLEELSDRRPDELSGGEQQRVAVARALAHRPKIVLADEPTANLDSKSSVSLLELMHRLHQHTGVTFIISSHDPLVLERAQRVIEMRDGALV